MVSVLFACAFFCFTKYTMPKKYVSTIGFTVVSSASDVNLSNPTFLTSNLAYARNIVKTRVRMLGTLDYYTKVSEQVNSDIDALIAEYPEHAAELEKSKKTAVQIGKSLSFSIIEETELFTVRVSTNSMSESKLIAEAVEKTANKHLTQLSVSADMLESEQPVADSVKCFEKPLMGKFAGPSISKNTVVGFIFGFILSFGIVFVLSILDVRIKSAYDLSEKYDIPVLGSVISFEPAKR